MVAVSGTYENGTIRLDKRILTEKKIKVIVTFLDDLVSKVERPLKIDDFSFFSSREKTKRFKGSLSDSTIEDRRDER